MLGWLRRVVVLTVLLAGAAGAALGQNFTAFSASNIQNLQGTPLVSGTLYIQGTDQVNTPISYQCGGGGQVVRTPYTATIASGAVVTFNVCNPANTLPAGIYYHIWVIDLTTGSSTLNQTVLNYGLVQWTGATFNFDDYTPTANTVAPTGYSITGNLGVNGNISVTGSITGTVLNTAGLGDNSTVIDVSVQAGSTWDAKYAAAQAICTGIYNNCVFDARRLTGTQTLAATVTPPENSTTLFGIMNMTESSGAYFNLYRPGVHLQGQGNGTYFVKASASDFTPIFYVAPGEIYGGIGGSGAEIDHVFTGYTTSSGSMMPITSVASTSATTITITAAAAANSYGLTVYSTAYFAQASVPGNQFLMTITGFSSPATANNGLYYCIGWTTSTITCENPGGVAATGASATGSIVTTTYTGTFTAVHQLYGTVTTSGSTFTLSQGQYFITGSVLVGQTITIGGSPYTVATITNALSGTTTTSIGTNTTAVAYSVPDPSFPVATCATNGCQGYEMGVFPYATSYTNVDQAVYDWGYAAVIASTSTTITLSQGQSPGSGSVSAYAVLAGGWALKGPLYEANIHEFNTYTTDLGIEVSTSGCSCYNNFSYDQLRTQHGSFFVGFNANSGNVNSLLAWAGDVGTVGYLNATGFAVRMEGGSEWHFKGTTDIENTRYSVQVRSPYTSFDKIALECDYCVDIGTSNFSGPASTGTSSFLPTILPLANTVTIGGAVSVVDYSGSNILTSDISTNRFGTQSQARDINVNQYGSVIVPGLPTPNSYNFAPSPTCASACSTNYQYYMVGRDFNMNPTQVYTPATVPNNAALSTGVNYNTLSGTYSPAGAYCWDILKGDTSHSLYTCVKYGQSPMIDDGSIATVAYPPAGQLAPPTTGNYTSMVEAGQVLANQGTACTTGELALSSGWGTSPTVTAVHGLGQTCQWTITAEATTGANPTITDTLTNPLPTATTVCWAMMVGGTGSSTMIAQTTLSATAPVFTFNGTPTAADTYIVVRTCGP